MRDRQEKYPSCELFKINWLGVKQDKIAIAGLEKALIDTKLDVDKDRHLFDRSRIILVSNQENILFTDTYIYGNGKEYKDLLAELERINSFIFQPSEDSLSMERDEKFLGYTGLGVSVFFGSVTFLILAMAPYITCSFDRKFNVINLDRRNLFKNKNYTIKISNIKEIKIEEQEGEESTNYRLTLFLKDGEKLPLTYFYTSGWQEKQQMYKLIKDFLSRND